MTTLYDPQRERILAALEARQAEEEAGGYPDPPPAPPEDLRRPNPWYRRLWDSLPGYWLVAKERLTGRPSCGPSCPTQDECADRAARRALRFWSWVYALVLIVMTAIGAWRWTS